jgi:Spy/CpxP family protein refolding chaperone
MNKLYRYTALALIVLLGSYQLVMARPGQGGGNQPGKGNDRGPVPFVQALQLTDEQVAKIGALIQESQTKCAVLQDKIQSNTNLMQAIQWSKDFSPEKVEAIMKEMRDTMNQLQLNHQKLDVDIKFLLTPEQLQKYNEIMSGPKEGQGRQMPMLFGKMTGLNLADKTFVFTAMDPEGKEIVFKVTFRDGTKFVRDMKLSKPEEFKDGEEVTVAGNINPEAKTIDAMMVALGKMEPPRDPGRGPGNN